jgi:hypothetical protein
MNFSKEHDMIIRSVVRNLVAIIVIFGHLIVFIVALSLGIFSLLRGLDAIQTIMMASPILAVISTAAFTYVIDDYGASKDDVKVSWIYALLCIVFPVILIAVVLVLFYLFYLQLDHFGPDQLKVTLGAVETFFGIFLGSISKSLFSSPRSKRDSSRSRPPGDRP